jgi:transcriptional repressor NrdR
LPGLSHFLLFGNQIARFLEGKKVPFVLGSFFDPKNQGFSTASRLKFMRCPACYHDETKVVDSRTGADDISIRRRRECLKCGFRFSTHEEVEILGLTVIKRDGRKEAYNREKLERGLKRALEKRPVSPDGFRKLLNNIERDIQVRAKNSEISSLGVGEIIMKRLRAFDKIGYIRFASVYQSFKDAKTFQRELDKLLGQAKK